MARGDGRQGGDEGEMSGAYRALVGALGAGTPLIIEISLKFDDYYQKYRNDGSTILFGKLVIIVLMVAIGAVLARKAVNLRSTEQIFLYSTGLPALVLSGVANYELKLAKEAVTSHVAGIEQPVRQGALFPALLVSPAYAVDRDLRVVPADRLTPVPFCRPKPDGFHQFLGGLLGPTFSDTIDLLWIVNRGPLTDLGAAQAVLRSEWPHAVAGSPELDPRLFALARGGGTEFLVVLGYNIEPRDLGSPRWKAVGRGIIEHSDVVFDVISLRFLLRRYGIPPESLATCKF